MFSRASIHTVGIEFLSPHERDPSLVAIALEKSRASKLHSDAWGAPMAFYPDLSSEQLRTRADWEQLGSWGRSLPSRRTVVLTVPASAVQLREFQVPHAQLKYLKPQEISQFVQEQLSSRQKPVYVDFSTHIFEDQITVSVYAIALETLWYWTDQLQYCSLSPDIIEIVPFSLRRLAYASNVAPDRPLFYRTIYEALLCTSLHQRLEYQSYSNLGLALDYLAYAQKNGDFCTEKLWILGQNIKITGSETQREEWHKLPTELCEISHWSERSGTNSFPQRYAMAFGAALLPWVKK